MEFTTNSPASIVIEDEDVDLSSSLSTISDDDGFVSGGEDFDTASEKPVILDPEEDVDIALEDPVVGLPVFAKRPVAVVTEDDDEEEEKECETGRVLDDVAVSEPGVVEPVSELGKKSDDVAVSVDAEPVSELGGKSNGVVGSDDVAVSGDDNPVMGIGEVVSESDKGVLGSGVVVEDESVEVFKDCDGDKEAEVAKLDTNVTESLVSVAGEVEKGTQVAKNEEPETVFVDDRKVDEKPEVVDSETENLTVAKHVVDEKDSGTSEGSETVKVESFDEKPKVGDSGIDNRIVGKHVVDEAGTETVKVESFDEKPEVEDPGTDNRIVGNLVVVDEVDSGSVEGSETVKVKSFDEKPEFKALESEDSNVAKGFDTIEKKEMELVNGSSSVVDKVDDDDVADSEVDDVAVKETEIVNGSIEASLVVEKDDNSDVDEEKFEEMINALDETITTNNPEETNNVVVSDRFDDAIGEEFDADSEDGMVFGSSQAAKQFMEELEREAGSGSRATEIDGQIATDSEEEEVETDGEGGEEREVFDSAAFAALLKAATGGGGGGAEGGNITITSQDGSRLFSIERPAGLGSVRSGQPMGVGMGRANRTALFAPASVETEKELSDEEKKKLDRLQKLRVKFLRLVRRLGASPEDSVAAQVLYRLAMVAGRPNHRAFSLEEAKTTALELEAEGKDDLDFSINVLVLGKCGVGKSSTINSVFGEEKAKIGAFEPGTTSVREIVGAVDGVKIKVIDTPGLKPAVMEQGFNRKVLSSVKRFMKKSPPDIILYVDRLDTQTRDLNDLPLLKTITGALGSPMWRNAIVALTHGASAPPEGPNGNPLSYEVSVTQRSHVVQQCIGHAVGDLRIASPSLMNPVSLVENHPLCRKNRDGQKVLPNGQTWRPQLLLLCYSMKILAEANLISKPQDPFDHRKLFGFRVRSPPLPYLLSSMLQTRAHPKLASDQGIDNGDSDAEMADFSDSDNEDEGDEYDQLPPFKPLKKAQLDKLSKEQRKAYFEEFDYRVKLLQKKQWKEEVKRVKEMKRREKGSLPHEYEEAAYEEPEGAAPVATPLPDMTLPPSFDSDNPAYRYRFLEPTSQFLARPVLDTHGWDHDCGYDGVNLEQSLALASKYPANVSVQVTKDKKDFSIHLDSSIAAKHGDDGSTMAGFDIQNVGKQLAYIVRGETKFKTLKRNKTAAGLSVTFLGENVATGLKIEDQIAFNKQWAMVGSAGTVRCQGDAAYGANFEIQRREIDYPIGQVQSTYGLSLIKWRGDWALGFNSVAQFALGRNSKVAVRAGINNKLSGQITARTSSSDHLSLVLVGVIPIASAIYKKIWPAAADNYFGY